MAAERAIQFATFALILIGICGVSAWASYAYLNETLILEVAGIALSWGLTLLILYLAFKRLDWSWWD
jgi:glycerol uptake facilitator-like aquaporin